MAQTELLTAPSPFDESVLITGCPSCKQCDQGFIAICDEPLCKFSVQCGLPTGDYNDVWGVYRTTCSNHMMAMDKIMAVMNKDKS